MSLNALAMVVCPALAQDDTAAPGPPPAREPVEASAEGHSDPDPAPEFLPPELLTFTEAAYPPGLDQGEVRVGLLLLIDEAGVVEKVDVLGGEPPFSDLAVEAARRFSFVPALDHGVPVAVELPFEYVFPAPAVSLAVYVALEGLGDDPGELELRVDGVPRLTSPDGSLVLRNLLPGTHELVLVHPAYEASRVLVEIVAGERVEVEMVARPVTEEDELVAVYRKTREATIRRTVTAEDVRTTPGTMGDPVRAVQNLPGVVRTPLDAGWLLVRGGDPEDTGLYIDGVRVPLIYHLGGFTSVVHPRMIEAVDFMPGGYDARFGRATGGAVNLRTRRAGRETRVEAGVDLVSSGLYTESSVKGVGVSAGVRRSYLDKVLAAVPSITEEQAQIAPKFWDWSMRVDSDRAGLLVLGYADTINTGFEGDVVAVTIGTARVHGDVRLDINGREWHLAPMFAQDWQVVQWDPVDDLRLSPRGGGRFETVDDGIGLVGYAGGVDVEGGNYGMRVSGLEAEANFASVDPYLAVRVGESTQLVGGVRAETLWVVGQLARAMPSPRLELRHPVGERLVLVGDWGLYHQWPGLDMAIGMPAGPYLRLEESWGGGSGARLDLGPLSFEADAYGRKLQYVTLFEDDGSLGQGDGLAYGVETLTRYDLGPLAGWVSYTWARSLRREEQGDLYEAHIYDQPHYLVAVTAVDLGRDWTLAGRWRYASGYPLIDATEAFDILTQSTVDLTLAVDEFGRLEPFYALDVKLSRHHEPRWGSMDLYLDIQNVTNHRVPEPAISGFQLGELVYTYGLPVLPVFGVTGAFVRPN